MLTAARQKLGRKIAYALLATLALLVLASGPTLVSTTFADECPNQNGSSC